MIKKILVIGGSVGGLTAALSLRARGFQCEVFEQNPKLDESKLDENGAGIQISPNAMHVLKYLGLDKKLEKNAFEPRSGVMRDYRTGKADMIIPFKGFCENRYGAQYLHIHRADLIALLEKTAKKIGIQFHHGQRARSYQQTNNSIAVIMDDKSKHHGDLLIGADGIHSAIREQMFGKNPANFTGQAAWRGTVPAEKLPKDLIPPDANVWLGPGRHFVAYYLRSKSLVNFVAVENRHEWSGRSWNLKGNMNDLRNAFAGWDGRIKILLEACNECFLWGLFDREPLPRWSDGRAVLLGDACHPMLPFMAQGAAMAIEDGFVLAHQLADRTQSLDQALEAYETKRKPRTTMMQKISRRNAKIYHMHSSIGRFGRKMILNIGKLLPRTMLAQFDQIYGENITSTET